MYPHVIQFEAVQQEHERRFQLRAERARLLAAQPKPARRRRRRVLSRLAAA